MTHTNNTRRAFTLIETIAVIVVIGIIAAITSPILLSVSNTYTQSLEQRTSAESVSIALDRIVRVTGRPCTGAHGQAALDRLATRVLGEDGAGRVFVFASGISGARHLPGRIILLDRSQVEDYETPAVAAGYLLAERQRAVETDPMRPLLDYAGPFATARLLTTGMLPDTVLDGYGEAVFTRAPEPVPTEPLLARFAAAGVPSTPYAFALDKTGETTLGLIEADPLAAGTAQPLLNEAEWAVLQEICTE